jgi:hypothetical protein
VYFTLQADGDFLVLCNIVDGVPILFLRNLDQIGHSEWADSHRETVYVPSDLSANQVPIPVAHAGERVTLMKHICPHGSFMKPMAVIPPDLIENDLPLFGLSDFRCHLCRQPNGFVDRELFEERFEQIYQNTSN